MKIFTIIYFYENIEENEEDLNIDFLEDFLLNPPDDLVNQTIQQILSI